MIPQDMLVEYLLGDHLGSASVVTDTSGNILGENRYSPYGETLDERKYAHGQAVHWSTGDGWFGYLSLWRALPRRGLCLFTLS